MTVLSTPVKNDRVMQKDLFRLSATLFSETSNEYSSLDSQLQMLKCVFVKKDNEPMSPEDISLQLLEIFKYHISDEDVEKVIKSHKKTFETVVVDDVTSYKLLESVLISTKEAQDNNIDSYIVKFMNEFNILELEKCSTAIYNYLYELTTTNINTYKILISGKKDIDFSDSDLSVDINYLSKEEQQYVHDFIAWENADKNMALSNIVFTCLEYCLLVNGDKPNRLLNKFIRKREIYLDTNIIFRVLGINGPIRQKTVKAFLAKCRQARLKLIISHNTRKEFFDTIDYYIQEILRYPRGNVCSGAYERLADYTLFNMYEDWRKAHPSMSMIYFKMFIQSSYEKMVKEYAIVDDEKIPDSIYHSEDFKQTRNSYSAAIKRIKDDMHDRYVSEDDRYSLKDSHDATIVRYVEMRRGENEDTDLFFVSSDKILRGWDLNRNENEYPVVIYPSQLFLVLIKTCGRSDNDFDSFVSFINVRSAHHQMPAEKANVIISGISTITEDIETQSILISAICGGEYQNIIQNTHNNDELYEAIQEVCKGYLEDELKYKESEIAALIDDAAISTDRIATLEETAVKHEERITYLQDKVDRQAFDIDERDKKIRENQKISEAQKDKVCAFAGKKTRIGYIFKWYVFPVITIAFVVFFCLFIALQLFYCDAKWNFVTKILDAIGETTLGKSSDGYVLAVNGALFTFMVAVVIPNFWVKPWDKEKRDMDKQDRIEKYIKKNKLL